MIPFRDVIPSRTTPVVTITLIAVHAIVFGGELWLDDESRNDLLLYFGLVPAAFSWVAVVTSMFLHGSLLHAATNLIYLWIFGGNVEDRMGHRRFLAFYVLCGAAGALAQTIAAPNSTIPMVGASGAIAGVLGAYFVLYPHSRILTLVPLVLSLQIVEVPAVLFLGLWVVLQLANGLGSIAGVLGGPQGVLAFWTPVAGFAAGAAGVLLFRRPERQRVEWWHAP